MTTRTSPIRVLIAKPGLDGHDRGAKVVARTLRDAGMEVIYTGLRLTLEQIVQAALQEDVDVIGLSILSGAHLGLTKRLMDEMQRQGMEDCLVMVGGTIPRQDVEKLKAMRVAAVFPAGASLQGIVDYITQNVRGESAD